MPTALQIYYTHLIFLPILNAYGIANVTILYYKKYQINISDSIYIIKKTPLYIYFISLIPQKDSLHLVNHKI